MTFALEVPSIKAFEEVAVLIVRAGVECKYIERQTAKISKRASGSGGG